MLWMDYWMDHWMDHLLPCLNCRHVHLGLGLFTCVVVGRFKRYGAPHWNDRKIRDISGLTFLYLNFWISLIFCLSINNAGLDILLNFNSTWITWFRLICFWYNLIRRCLGYRFRFMIYDISYLRCLGYRCFESTAYAVGILSTWRLSYLVLFRDLNITIKTSTLDYKRERDLSSY